MTVRIVATVKVALAHGKKASSKKSLLLIASGVEYRIKDTSQTPQILWTQTRSAKRYVPNHLSHRKVLKTRRENIPSI